ncbi:MAG TPA: ABC transporter permease [Candidatus Atribacteria bacterium]|nr:ABC transporter permease [Candidatus Atribacteria bacterium]
MDWSKEENLVSLSAILILRLTLRKTTPLLLAALGGLFSERVGIANIALEGMMLTGAFFAVIISYFTQNPWLGVLAGMISGMGMSFLLGVASIKFKANQTVTGAAINIMALGITGFLLETIFEKPGNSPIVPKIEIISLPFIKDIPVWGEIISSHHIFVYTSFALVLILHLFFFKTPLGLHMRSVGEHPMAADTMGINVYKMRYLGVSISGILAGLAGASLALGDLSFFAERMTAGRGYIALAALIFGKWTPLGVLGSTLFFGFADALQESLQGIGKINIPSEFFLIIPFILSLIVLAGFVGRARPPASIGVPYEKEEG